MLAQLLVQPDTGLVQAQAGTRGLGSLPEVVRGSASPLLESAGLQRSGKGGTGIALMSHFDISCQIFSYVFICPHVFAIKQTLI